MTSFLKAFLSYFCKFGLTVNSSHRLTFSKLLCTLYPPPQWQLNFSLSISFVFLKYLRIVPCALRCLLNISRTNEGNWSASPDLDHDLLRQVQFIFGFFSVLSPCNIYSRCPLNSDWWLKEFYFPSHHGRFTYLPLVLPPPLIHSMMSLRHYILSQLSSSLFLILQCLLKQQSAVPEKQYPATKWALAWPHIQVQ